MPNHVEAAVLELIGKRVLQLTLVVLVVAFFVGSAKAYTQANITALDVSVSANPDLVIPRQEVKITAITNMNGLGIVFVIQPDRGSSTASSESADVQTDLDTISSDGHVSLHMIVSYAFVGIANRNGGSRELTFPNDFRGLNGEPSTKTPGRYSVFFVFIHLYICRIGFDCANANFFVIPEVPLGTLTVASASFAALLGHVGIKRFRTKRP